MEDEDEDGDGEGDGEISSRNSSISLLFSIVETWDLALLFFLIKRIIANAIMAIMAIGTIVLPLTLPILKPNSPPSP